MKSRLRTLVTVALPMLLAACSWITDFVIVNPGPESVTVRYTFRECPRCRGGFILDRPRLQAYDGSIPDMVPRWVRLPESAYTLTPESRTLEIALPPETMLLVTQLGSYTGELGDSQRFNVVGLEIEAPSGEMRLQGDSVRQRFRERSNRLYFIEVS